MRWWFELSFLLTQRPVYVIIKLNDTALVSVLKIERVWKCLTLDIVISKNDIERAVNMIFHRS